LRGCLRRGDTVSYDNQLGKTFRRSVCVRDAGLAVPIPASLASEEAILMTR
jgi:hypothetical protein